MPSRGNNTCKGLRGGKLYKLTRGWGSSEPWYQAVAKAEATWRKDILQGRRRAHGRLPPYSHCIRQPTPQSHIHQGGGLGCIQAATQKKSTEARKENTRKGNIEHKCDFSWLFPTLQSRQIYFWTQSLLSLPLWPALRLHLGQLGCRSPSVSCTSRLRQHLGPQKLDFPQDPSSGPSPWMLLIKANWEKWEERHLFSFCHVSRQTPAVSGPQNQREALMQHKELKLGSVLHSEEKSQAAFCQACCLCVSVTQITRGSAGLAYLRPLIFATCHLSPPVPNACKHCLSGKHSAPLPPHPGWPCSLLLGSLGVPQPLLEFPMLLASHSPPPASSFSLQTSHKASSQDPKAFTFRQVMLPFTAALLHRCSFYLEHPFPAALSLTVINELTLIPPSSLSFRNPVVFIRTKIYCTEW